MFQLPSCQKAMTELHMGFASLTSVHALRDDDESKVPGTSSLTFEG